EVARAIRLEVEDEFVKPFGGHDLVSEVLVVICLTVLVEVMVARELVAAAGIDHIVHDHDPQRFIHAGSEPAPFTFFHLFVEAADNPYIPIVRAERGTLAIGKEIKTAETHAPLPRVL